MTCPSASGLLRATSVTAVPAASETLATGPASGASTDSFAYAIVTKIL